MKKISTAFETELAKGVLALALLVTLVRPDGTRVTMTNHDEALVFEGVTYRNDIPFTLSAISTDSSLNSDNVTLDVALDEVTFRTGDFRLGRWKKTGIEIAHVNFNDLTQGKIILRQGLLRQSELRKNGSARMDFDGLLKVLDFTVGRLYLPSCDAEFGDHRCRVAVKYSQHRSFLNPYGTGDWAYWYDTSLMTTNALTNPSFAADGDRTTSQAITGWTKATNAMFVVDDGGVNVVPHRNANRVLASADTTTAAPEEQSVSQVITLGASATDIDNGKIIHALFVEVAQRVSGGFAMIRVDMLDDDDNFVHGESTGWFQLDDEAAWREKAVVQHVLPTVRSARVTLSTRRLSGSNAAFNFTALRSFYWDHTAVDPTHGMVFKTVAVQPGTRVNWQYPINPGFEADGALAFSATQNITGWSKDAGQFKTDSVFSGSFLNPAASGSFAVWSNPASGEVSTLSQTIELEDYGVDVLDVDASDVSMRLSFRALRPAAGGAIRSTLRAIAADGVTVISSTPVRAFTATGTGNNNFALPPNTRFVKLDFDFQRSTADTEGMGLDDVQFVFVTNSQRPRLSSDVGKQLFGLEATEPDYTINSVTVDGEIDWKGRTINVQTDVVSAVTDFKTFSVTDMVGSEGAYEATRIKWLSGENAGVENIIRIWDGDAQTVKCYYPQPSPIQVGDRFTYVQGCQKRFDADCKLKFDNAVNFRGFPFVPGNTAEEI